MIEYDPHVWWATLYHVRGSMVRDIVGRVFLFVAWSAVVTVVSKLVHPLHMSGTVHSLAGFAMSLLLVFRTNASYDRFWEGRKLWGGIVNETRNLARGAGTQLRNEPDLLRGVLRWTATLPYAAMATLRNDPSLCAEAPALTDEEAARVRAGGHRPSAVARELTTLLDEGRRRGAYGEVLHAHLDQNVQCLIDYVGGCERIRKTPIPFAYMVHVRRGLIVYIVTLPFALEETFGWGTILATFVVAYLFMGIEEIGVEIEDPFGRDDNDLPLDQICLGIRDHCMALLPPENAS